MRTAYRADSEAYNQSYRVGLRSVTKPSHGVVRSQPDRQKMRYAGFALCVLLVVFSAYTAVGQVGRPELIGQWRGIAKTPVGTLDYQLTINKIDGEKVAGTLLVVPSRVYTGEEPFEGTLVGSVLQFTTVKTERTATLTIEGNVMSGEGRGVLNYKIENVRKVK